MGESAWGDAVVTVTQAGAPLSFWFPDPRLGPPGPGEIADPALADEREDPVRGVRIGRQVCVIADLDQPPF